MKKDIGINDQKIVIRKTGGAFQMQVESVERTDHATVLFLLGTAAGCIAADILKKVPDDGIRRCIQWRIPSSGISSTVCSGAGWRASTRKRRSSWQHWRV